MEIETKKSSLSSNLILILAVLVIVTAIFFAIKGAGVRFEDLTPSRIKQYILSFGTVKGAFIFLAINTFSIRPFIPVPPLLYTLAAGYTFGPLWGAVLSTSGSTLNACICFLLSRVFGKDFIERISRGKVEKLNARLKQNAFRTLLLLRLTPIGLPYDFVSYSAGILKIPFKTFFLASFIGIIPECIVYSYFAGSLTKMGFAAVIAFLLVLTLALLLIPRYLKRRKQQPA